MQHCKLLKLWLAAASICEQHFVDAPHKAAARMCCRPAASGVKLMVEMVVGGIALQPQMCIPLMTG